MTLIETRHQHSFHESRPQQRPARDDWRFASCAPKGIAIQLLVCDNFGEYKLPFPCELSLKGVFLNQKTKSPLAATVKKWRPWRELTWL